jgi:DNA-binding beta-propeller fold protein YncE/mono/diheme cytochrome c family protein
MHAGRGTLAPIPHLILAAVTLVLSAATARASGSPDGSFVNFESGQVRPLALSPDGTRLLATNTPDNRVEIFRVEAGGLVHAGSVPVGLEPVAVAMPSNDEAWVVNHLSDSVSIVDLATDPPRVRDTLLTCDEPRDVVFAGPGGTRAFITTARRGQNCPLDDASNTAGVGRAVVQVFDTTNLGTDVQQGGVPLANVVLFGDVPRALARSADGSTVYAGIFGSGNQTTAVGEFAVCDGGASAPPCVRAGRTMPGGLPAPNADHTGEVGPEVGLIVKRNPASGRWEDELARDWSPAISFELPDLDVFAIDAATLAETQSFPHVGSVLFGIATNPVTGTVYVSNTDARNEVRFEGPGTAFGSTTVQGHLHEARVTVIEGGVVSPRHLNKHIDYDVRPAPPGVKQHSLATPTGMAVTADGETLYVAAFGSAKIGVFSTAALEDDSFVPDAASHIALEGGGPTGLVLDEARDRLYAFTRFDDAVSVVRLSTAEEIAHVSLHSPEPRDVVAGRALLYDASHTSSNGEASCSSCHVFGDNDQLAWDLGNPDDETIDNPIPQLIPPLLDTFPDFHPLKGPMTTQSLRGMADHGSMHWRGDRTGGNDPGGDPFDEDAAFEKFNVAFPGLLGRDDELTAAEMQAFTDFALTITYPPNPIRRLDNALRTREQRGRDLYFGRRTDTAFNCNGCHTLDRSQGFFGSDGRSTFEGETQMFKVPHLRNVYTKVGMFGQIGNAPQGPQVRGYGVLHDGVIDTVFNFLGASVFDLTNMEQRDLERFVLVFDSNLAPIVGQQVTLRAGSPAGVTNRLDLMIERAQVADECEVIVKGVLDGEARGGLRLADGTFQLDRAAEAPVTDAELRLRATTAGQQLTYTCVPVLSGERMALDRDEDGFYDRDELDAGTDPADPASFPGAPTGMRTATFVMNDDDRPPLDARNRKLTFRSSPHRGQASGVVVPAFDADGDPSAHGATLTIYRPGGDGSDTVVFSLPNVSWKRLGNPAKPGYRYRDPTRFSGPINTVTLQNGRLTIRGRGDGLFALAGAPQGAMALRLVLGSGEELCAVAEPREPSAKYDAPGLWKAEADSPPPDVCPLIP